MKLICVFFHYGSTLVKIIIRSINESPDFCAPKGFLASKDGEKRLERLRQHLERAGGEVPPQSLPQLMSWLKEQEEEVATFRTHCQNRQKQMEATIGALNR